jgi:hypothetical protein
MASACITQVRRASIHMPTWAPRTRQTIATFIGRARQEARQLLARAAVGIERLRRGTSAADTRNCRRLHVRGTEPICFRARPRCMRHARRGSRAKAAQRISIIVRHLSGPHDRRRHCVASSYSAPARNRPPSPIVEPLWQVPSVVPPAPERRSRPDRGQAPKRVKQWSSESDLARGLTKETHR